MVEHIFCRDICIERGEPLAGAGSAAKRYILLHWPRAHWRVPRTQSHTMPVELADAIMTANAAGLHVALVDGDDIALSCDNINITQIEPQKAAQLIYELADGAKLEGEKDNRITIVCCTDAKQDPCCARYGFATWKALKAQADPQHFRILQSTHLGGCRFAASVIVLPQRARYSRLQPENIANFLEHIKKGTPYLPAYRGNPELDALSQVAEHAALTWAQEKGLHGNVSFPHPITEPHDGTSIIIDTVIGSYVLEISLRKTSFPVNTRCVTLKDESDPTQIMRWIAVNIRVKI
ncbi:sucrase ferredoxin [Paenochrobactrum sp. BZR 201-1]